MNILPQVEDILKEYDLKRVELPEGYSDIYSYLRIFPNETQKFHTDKDDGYFIRKYRNHIPQGWYGFSIGNPIIPEWCEIIDRVLEICVASDPEFEIHQIKLKFGGIRFYTFSEVIDDIGDVEVVLANRLFDRALIW